MRKLTLLFSIMALIALFAVPAVAQEDEMAMPDFIQHTACEVDLTGGSIPIIHLGDTSGAYAPITQPLLAGLADAAAYYNAMGGICGAEILVGDEYRVDTGGNPANVEPGYTRLKELDPDVLILYSSTDSVTLRPFVEADEIPVLISAGSIAGLYGEDAMTPGWIYATNPLYADQFAMFCEYIGSMPEMYPDPVVAYMGWGGPVAEFGLAAYTDEAIAYCESVGVSVLPAIPFLPIATVDSLAPLVNQAYDDGANIIYVNALATGPVRIAEALEQEGLLGEFTLGSVNWGLDSSVAFLSMGSLSEADGLPVVNGLIGSMPFGWWSEVTRPGIQLINEQADLNERAPTVRGISYILAWTLVDIYIEMYIQTANRVGSLDAIEGADIRETVENMVYEPLGLQIFNFEGGELRALSSNRIVQMRFLNATGDGVATSGDDAFKVPLDGGATYYPPIIVPLLPADGSFQAAPSMLPGMDM
ncbi:MAG: ABC transporter substrate-binding protein [Phototrophicales bacterium]|nr:ABC transporter substrate-binding protein [Phototrophicales bacterium]